MTRLQRSVGFLFSTAAAGLVLHAAFPVAAAQEPAPNRREFTITARDYRFSPEQIEVTHNDLVKLTVKSEDVAYGFTIDQYRVSKRIPAGGSVTFEFRVDKEPGTFPFYSNMTSDQRHAQMKGQLVVKAK